MTDYNPESDYLAAETILNGRYRIKAPLGVGGFAVVYEGFDEIIERSVAIKILDMSKAGRERNARKRFTERFYKEAKAAARIEHPNIVTIYDVGNLHPSGQPYIVMELLKGHDIETELFKNGPIAPTRALPLFCRCLEALEEGHKQGIVHRDLKPSNLFLSSPNTLEEELRVLDFGIAVLGAYDTRLTATNQVFGTAAYMSPEYILSKAVSPALDVYQMGLILVEVLTARRVVDDENNLACVVKHTNGNLRVPSVLLDGPLGAVLTSTLAMKPEERYEDAGAFRRALLRINPADIQTSLATDPFTYRVGDLSSSQRSVSHPASPDTDVKQLPRTIKTPTVPETILKPLSTTIALDEQDLLEATIPLALNERTLPSVRIKVVTEPVSVEPISFPHPQQALRPKEETLTFPSVDKTHVSLEENSRGPSSARLIGAGVGLILIIVLGMAAIVFITTPKPIVVNLKGSSSPKVLVRVETDPGGATLYKLFKGKKTFLSKAPHSITFDSKNASFQDLIAEQQGYQSKQARISPKGRKEVLIKLEREIMITVNTKPLRANLSQKKNNTVLKLGVSPQTIILPPEGSVEVTAKYDGYEDTSITLTSSNTPNFLLELKAKPTNTQKKTRTPSAPQTVFEPQIPRPTYKRKPEATKRKPGAKKPTPKGKDWMPK